MTTLNEIQQFLAPKKIAIAGVSRNPKKFGGSVFRELNATNPFLIYPKTLSIFLL